METLGPSISNLASQQNYSLETWSAINSESTRPFEKLKNDIPFWRQRTTICQSSLSSRSGLRIFHWISKNNKATFYETNTSIFKLLPAKLNLSVRLGRWAFRSIFDRLPKTSIFWKKTMTFEMEVVSWRRFYCALKNRQRWELLVVSALISSISYFDFCLHFQFLLWRSLGTRKCMSKLELQWLFDAWYLIVWRNRHMFSGITVIAAC